MVERRRFATSMGASALLHLLLLMALFLYATAPKRPVAVPSVEVDLSSLPLPRAVAPPRVAPEAKTEANKQEEKQVPAVVPQRQIVQPSDSGVEKEPQNTNLLSDRNNTVPEESVHQGDQGTNPNASESRLSHKGGGGEAQQPPQQQQAPPPAPAPEERPRQAPRPPAAEAHERARNVPAAREPGDENERLASVPSLSKLLPNAAEMAENAPLPPATPQTQRSGRDLLNSGGQVFDGRPGTRDFLPHVREGNITMLNTKADLFAPFVRRVAGRVFENLELGLSSLRYTRGVGTGRAQATVEAIMDRNGHFVSANLVDRSGPTAVDRLLLGSATPDTFFDANPPSGAEANDGKIHFMLLIDLQILSFPDPRSGREEIGYNGIAAVGLK